MSSAALKRRRVIPVLAITIYLGLPVLMGITGGFIEGFLPALLWPMPVVVGIIGVGSIPFWAGSVLGDRGFVALWVAQAALVVAVGVLGRDGWPRAKRRMAIVWGAIAVINILLWIKLGPYPD